MACVSKKTLHRVDLQSEMLGSTALSFVAQSVTHDVTTLTDVDRPLAKGGAYIVVVVVDRPLARDGAYLVVIGVDRPLARGGTYHVVTNLDRVLKRYLLLAHTALEMPFGRGDACVAC